MSPENKFETQPGTSIFEEPALEQYGIRPDEAGPAQFLAVEEQPEGTKPSLMERFQSGPLAKPVATLAAIGAIGAGGVTANTLSGDHESQVAHAAKVESAAKKYMQPSSVARKILRLHNRIHGKDRISVRLHSANLTGKGYLIKGKCLKKDEEQGWNPRPKIYKDTPTAMYKDFCESIINESKKNHETYEPGHFSKQLNAIGNKAARSVRKLRNVQVGETKIIHASNSKAVLRYEKSEEVNEKQLRILKLRKNKKPLIKFYSYK